MALGQRLARAWDAGASAYRDHHDREEEKRRREIQQAAMLLGLRNSGAVPAEEAQDTRIGLPNLTEGMGGIGQESSVSIPSSQRYKPLGKTGYVHDTMGPQTRSAANGVLQEQRQARREEAERRQRRTAVEIAARRRAERDPSRVLSETERDAVADDPVLYRDFIRDAFKPDAFGEWQRRRDYDREHPRTRTNPTSESPVVRDARRAAERNRHLLNTTSRELTALNREIGAYPDADDTTSGRIARRDRLGARRDSLHGEVDRFSRMATDESLGNYLPVEPGGSGDDQQAQMQAELVEARRAYDASLRLPGADAAEVRRLYAEVVAAIRQKFGAR